MAKSKGLGRTNPNCKYPNVKDSLLAEIDSEGKAYLLGWLASDGHLPPTGSVVITIHRKDAAVLYSLRLLIGGGSIKPLRTRPHMMEFRFCSTQLMRDACCWLGIAPGNKAGKVSLPSLPISLQWAFLRGFFDGDGSIRLPSSVRLPECSIATTSSKMRAGILALPGVGGTEDAKNGQIRWSGLGALDFLFKLYDGANYFLSRKRDLYLDWCTWAPVGQGKRSYCADVRYARMTADALPLLKHRASDSGYDIAIVGISKQVGDVTLYRTGVKVQPPDGYYFDLIPRSSIIKTGYALANSVGVIDRTYTGEVLVPLRKVDPGAPDLQMPARVVQLIPRQILHFQVVCVPELGSTDRGANGFGSTDASGAKR